MRVSLNTIKQFVDISIGTDELVAKINAQLGGVEQVVDLSGRYKDVVIAKVISCEKHPNADKLSVCMIEAGKPEPVQVVCGAPNVRKDLFVAWLPPGSTVPSSYEESEPFVLGERELRGVLSHGMLASPKELGLGDSHEGILEITDEVKPGDSFAEIYALNDVLIDIENKMFTHRPDCFGQLGVAREIAGILNQPFESPAWYTITQNYLSGEGLNLRVSNKAGDVVPRFIAAAFRNITVQPSPLWLQSELVRLGSKPINNIVDITNYIMLITGQPLHAYDYDLLDGGELSVRLAERGEVANLLNGKTYELADSDIVITDGQKIIGLGGVMGGGNSEVSEMTKNIVIECATFDMYAIRKTSMRHGLFTDAVTRFNKGQSPLQNDYVMSRALHYIEELAGGELASQVFDAHGSKKLVESAAVVTSPKFINDRLGLTLAASDIHTLLTNVEFKVNEKSPSKGDELTILPPYWRTDIELPEDIVEEVGRLYGFDKLPKILPLRTLTPPTQEPRLLLKKHVREVLARAGANEVLTYSFVHEKTLTRAGQSPSHAYKLSNALSPDLQYYRTSLMASLLDKVHMNYRAGYERFALFELGKVHFKGEMDELEPSVPNEDDHVAFVITDGKPDQQSGSAYYHARRYLDQVLQVEGLELRALSDFDVSTDLWGAQLCAAYDPDRSAVIIKDNQVWGVIGEFKQAVNRAFKLPDHTAGFEVHLDMLNQENHPYRPLSKFPSVWQDISLKIPTNAKYGRLYDIVRRVTDNVEWHVTVKPTSIYQEDMSSKDKTISFRVTATSYTETLTDDAVSKLLRDIADSTKSIGAVQV